MPSAADDDEQPSRPSVACSWCGRIEAGVEPPLTWSMQVTERGVQTLCEPCTRINVRSIEAKLDSEWW